MMKTEMLPQNEPICKKIQNYIFKFSDLLGKGNFSKVYKAHHEITNSIVAVKIVELNSLKSKKLEELLFSEIDVLKKLNHPNILQCHQVFTSNRNCYIITELCNGGDLETKLRREHHFSEQNAQPIIKDIFSGLLYLSQKNVIHRDLKVANVFLHNGKAKIADFGFAKFTRDNFKDINIGSPIYMSPEGLINNIYGPKTDIWAFGVLIYQLLHGETPFAHCRTEPQLKYHVSIPVSQKKMRAELSGEIKEIISLCMEIDENKRITANQLQELPYFKRIMEKSPLKNFQSGSIDKKYSSASQKYIGVSTPIGRNMEEKKFLFLPFEKPVENMSKNYTSKSPNPLIDTRNVHRKNENITVGVEKNRKGQSIEKKVRPFQKESPEPNHNMSLKQLDNYKKVEVNESYKILSTPITFKECVNILHYCRLVYKYIMVLRQSPYLDEKQLKIFSSWALALMDEIKKKINSNGITYEGENAWLREKKLREVTNEYLKKYKSQLVQHNVEISLGLMKNYIHEVYQKYDVEISKDKEKSLLILGHFVVMIYDCTHLLKRCFQQKSYKSFGNYKEIQNFLNKNKESMDTHSYMLIRKKVSFIKEKQP